MKVEKRDGTIQDFRFDKIVKVIEKVFSDKWVNEEVPEKFIEQVKEYFDKFVEKHDENYVMPIEDIQDVIRDFLIKKNKIKAAEAFILYRKRREEIREEKNWLIKEITKKLNAKNVENQNANLDEASFGGRIGEASRVVTKNMALKHMSKQHRDNHNDNKDYIHDLDSYEVGMHNCLSIPFDRLLKDGFDTRQTDVRGAGAVYTASQLVAVIFQVQSLQQFGGVAATHIDWTMVPYVRKSFYKHYIDGLKYIKGIEGEELDMINIPVEELSIEHGWYKADEDVYRYAMDMTERECHQAVEGLFHNLNTLQSRSGNQLPFTSLNYGTCTLAEGRMYTKAILEVSIEGLGKFGRTAIFPCQIFQIRHGVNDKPGTPNYDLKQLALKSTSKRLYPNYCLTNWSNHEKWVDLDRKNKLDYVNSLSKDDYDTLVEQLKKHPELKELLDLEIYDVDGKLITTRNERPVEAFSTMGCRTVNGYDVNFMDEYKRNIQAVIDNRLKDVSDDMVSGIQKDGRGNIAPITVILPTLAMEAKEQASQELDNETHLVDLYKFRERSVEIFKSLLEKHIRMCKDELLERFKHIASQSSRSAVFMYENHTMAGYHPEEGIQSALKHGTLVIGQLGVAEALQILIGCDQCEERGMQLAKEIEQMYNDLTAEFKKEYKMNFGVYYTPAESLCHTAFKKWKDKYGDMENVTYYYDENGIRQERDYFTNSVHVPVYKHLTPFEKIDIESQLTGYSNAGCITYVEVDGAVIHNIEALEEIVDYAMDHDIPYFAVNLNNAGDMCEDCGYQGYIPSVCPKCGSPKVSRLRRVTGYLTGNYKPTYDENGKVIIAGAFNDGKVSETDQRVIHKKTIDLSKNYLDN